MITANMILFVSVIGLISLAMVAIAFGRKLRGRIQPMQFDIELPGAVNSDETTTALITDSNERGT